MKQSTPTTWLSGIILLTATALPPVTVRAADAATPNASTRTYSSFDLSSGTNAAIPTRMIKFEEADLNMVVDLYETLSGRTLIRSPQLPTAVTFTFRNAQPLTFVEALQLLDDVLASHGIAVVYLGTQYVKLVPAAAASTEPTPVIERPWQQLPQSSSPLTYIVKLKYLAAEQATSMLQPFARLPNSIIAMKGSDVLILRDYSGNVRRMAEVLERVDKPVN